MANTAQTHGHPIVPTPQNSKNTADMFVLVCFEEEKIDFQGDAMIRH